LSLRTEASSLKRRATVEPSRASRREAPRREPAPPHVGPRERILDVAIELFATAGYAGTTTRDIARRARVKLGQLHYYFASKRALFEAVVQRLGGVVTDRRRLLLDEANARWPDGRIPVEVLVDALVRSLLLGDVAGKGSGRLTAPTQMHARLQTDPDEIASAVRAAMYDETTLGYVAAFRRALPHLPAAVIYWRVHFMMGAYLWTLLGPGRLGMISRGTCDAADLDAAVREIVPFLCAGLTAPVPKSLPKEAGARAARRAPASRRAKGAVSPGG
jgi:AcrR family transcriptional regulator